EDDRGALAGEVDIIRGRIMRGRLEKSSQHRGFRKGEGTGGLLEKTLRGRLNAIGAAAEIDAVQIERENLLLAVARLQPDGEQHFPQLAADRAVGLEKDVL